MNKIMATTALMAGVLLVSLGIRADNSEKIKQLEKERMQVIMNGRRSPEKFKEFKAKADQISAEIQKLKEMDSKAKIEANAQAENAEAEKIALQKKELEKQIGGELSEYNIARLAKVKKGQFYYYKYSNQLSTGTFYYQVFHVVEDGLYLICSNKNILEPTFCIADPDGDYVDKDRLEDGIYKCVGTFSNGVWSLRKLERVKVAIPEGFLKALDFDDCKKHYR